MHSHGAESQLWGFETCHTPYTLGHRRHSDDSRGIASPETQFDGTSSCAEMKHQVEGWLSNRNVV
jgi:hypothetical protein